MNTNIQPLNKIININNMCDKIVLLNLGPIPELQATERSGLPVEELIADISMNSLFEAQDDLLFALKHCLNPVSIPFYSNEDEGAENIKIPRKRLKTFHEHPIPEPMNISKSSEKLMYSCCAGCIQTNGQFPLEFCRRAYPDHVIEIYSDDSDEERSIDEYDPHRTFKSATIASLDEEDEYYNEIWILEEEAKRRYPRRSRPEGLEEIAVRLFEDEVEVIMPIVEDDIPVPPMPVLERQNTQFTINGVIVYNGNPNGSRFFDDDLL